MVDAELIAALTPLIIAIATMIFQYIKGKDTNKHGDAFIAMLKGNVETMNKVAVILPSLQPYVKEYGELVAEAETIWNSGGMTADDIRFIQAKAELYQNMINELIKKYRAPTTVSDVG